MCLIPWCQAPCPGTVHPSLSCVCGLLWGQSSASCVLFYFHAIVCLRSGVWWGGCLIQGFSHALRFWNFPGFAPWLREREKLVSCPGEVFITDSQGGFEAPMLHSRAWNSRGGTGAEHLSHMLGGCPHGASGEESPCQYSRLKRHGFIPWVGKIPRRRAWQPTPIFWSGESHEHHWWATVHEVTKSQTRLKWLSMHAHIHYAYVPLGRNTFPPYISMWGLRPKSAWPTELHSPGGIHSTSSKAAASQLPFLLYFFTYHWSSRLDLLPMKRSSKLNLNSHLEILGCPKERVWQEETTLPLITKETVTMAQARLTARSQMATCAPFEKVQSPHESKSSPLFLSPRLPSRSPLDLSSLFFEYIL